MNEHDTKYPNPTRFVFDIGPVAAGLLHELERPENDQIARLVENVAHLTAAVNRALGEIHRLCPPDPVVGLWTRLHFPARGLTVEMESIRMNVTLQPGESVVATASFKHPRTGRPADVENAAWSSENEAIATVVADPVDPSTPGVTTATVTAVSDPTAEGSAVIHCVVDTTPGEGETLLDLVGTVVIPPDNTVVGELVFGTPMPAPTP